MGWGGRKGRVKIPKDESNTKQSLPKLVSDSVDELWDCCYNMHIKKFFSDPSQHSLVNN